MVILDPEIINFDPNIDCILILRKYCISEKLKNEFSYNTSACDLRNKKLFKVLILRKNDFFIDSETP